MSYHQENSVVFSLDNLRALAGATSSGRRRLASVGPGDATSFLNLASLNCIDSSPAALHAPSMLIAPTRRAPNRWLFPALVSLGVLLLLFSGLALAVVVKKHRAQQGPPQLAAVITEAPPIPSQPQVAALTPAPAQEQERASQAETAASASQAATSEEAPATSGQTVAERKNRRLAPTTKARRGRRLARQRQLRRARARHSVRKVRSSRRRAGTRLAARSTRKTSKKAQDLDSLLLGF